jgi:hypothetical protein
VVVVFGVWWLTLPRGEGEVGISEVPIEAKRVEVVVVLALHVAQALVERTVPCGDNQRQQAHSTTMDFLEKQRARAIRHLGQVGVAVTTRRF